MNQRTIILTNGNYFARVILEKYILLNHKNICGILIITGDYKGRSKFKALYELSKVTALPYILFKIIQILIFSGINLFSPGKYAGVEWLAKKYHLPVKNVVSVKLQDAYAWVKDKDPRLIVSVSCPQLIPKKYLDLASLGGVNIHSSLLPKYAGLAPYFWVLANGEEKTGITVHYMTTKFDQGNILRQKSIDIYPKESAHDLFFRLSLLGKELLPEAIDLAYQGYEGEIQNLDNHSYYSHPSFKAYKTLRKNKHALFRISDYLSLLK